MPVLHAPRIRRMRDENPPELFLRLLSLVYQHQASQHHSSPPHELLHTQTQPGSAAAVVRADNYLVSSLRALAYGDRGEAAADKADCECSSEQITSGICGSAHQRQGTPAPTFLIHVRSLLLHHSMLLLLDHPDCVAVLSTYIARS